MTGIVAMNVVAMALIMQSFLGAPVWLMITIVLGGHLTFIFLGGMWALTLTDVVQVLLGFLCLPALAVYCLVSYGGWELIETSFVTATPLTSGVLGSFPWFQLSYPSVLTVSLVIGFFIQWGGNYYWLRAAAARTEPIARWQFIIGGLLVLVIHGSIGVLGLYAGSVHRAAFLDPVNPANPMGAYGLLMRDFPPLWHYWVSWRPWPLPSQRRVMRIWVSPPRSRVTSTSALSGQTPPRKWYYG